uniref:Bacteriophage T5 Orf172 DNA-binding domain-containing protein n=1 Tax=viral metagenome TaxID=1070528 RepID=A0A6C0HTS6_9ZZZZ
MTDTSLNFVALVESSPITRLNREYNNKFINQIKETFTETQQQLFISSLYCFLNHHPTSDYVIDLDNVWLWMGFNQKYNALRLLEKHFVAEKDYKSLLLRTEEQKNEGRGGHNKQTVLLNVKTFKLLCIKADTKKSHEIHEYFVKLEELLQTIVLEESNELRLQLEQLKEENSLMQLSRKVPTIYIYHTDTQVKSQPLLKIGITHCIADRVKPYKTTHPHGKVIFTQEVDEGINLKTVEHSIHNKLSQFKVQGENFRIDTEEAITCVVSEYMSYKLFQTMNESERKPRVKMLHEITNQILDTETQELLRKIHTCDSSTQTDFDELDPLTIPLIQDNQEIISKFDIFIQEHCIVRSDVQVSAKDIVGQYRLYCKEAKKEITQAFSNYLKRRFAYTRLTEQNMDQVVMGFSGIMLKPIEYKKGTVYNDEETFVFERCVFTPSGTAIYKDIWEEYTDWKRTMKKPLDKVKDDIDLKQYLKNSSYTLFDTVWASGGSGQGFYGIKLKRDEKYHRNSSTGCAVLKKDSNHHILSEYITISKAAEAESICTAKMSRSIKNHSMFGTGDQTYYYTKK